LKERQITHENIVKALAQAKDARIQILRKMLETLGRPRPEISPNAPRILTIRINPEKIGAVIGPGGKGIRRIEAESGANVDIEDDGTVTLSSLGYEGAEKAREMIEQITEGVKVGKIYNGRVSSIKDFGAFIEVAPGQDGLCHISELSDGYVKSVQDVVRVGDEVRVKVINVDDQGRVKLSRKAVLLEERNQGGNGHPEG
jgi:polyribonucleotide nucleotidyltransferase